MPVAVWLALREAKDQSEAVRSQEEKRAAARRTEVLAALRHELGENVDTLSDRRKSGKRELAVPFLQDEVWAAMSDGSELRWMNNVDLLRQLARSYLFVRTNIFLERQAFEVIHYPGMRTGPQPETKILEYLDSLDHVVRAAIDEGMTAIDRAVGGVERAGERG